MISWIFALIILLVCCCYFIVYFWKKNNDVEDIDFEDQRVSSPYKLNHRDSLAINNSRDRNNFQGHTCFNDDNIPMIYPESSPIRDNPLVPVVSEHQSKEYQNIRRSLASSNLSSTSKVSSRRNSAPSLRSQNSLLTNPQQSILKTRISRPNTIQPIGVEVKSLEVSPESVKHVKIDVTEPFRNLSSNQSQLSQENTDKVKKLQKKCKKSLNPDWDRYRD